MGLGRGQGQEDPKFKAIPGEFRVCYIASCQRGREGWGREGKEGKERGGREGRREEKRLSVELMFQVSEQR